MPMSPQEIDADKIRVGFLVDIVVRAPVIAPEIRPLYC